MKSDTVVLNMTGPPTDAIHGVNRLMRTSCPLSPVFQHFSRKYQHPPTDIAAWHSVHRGRSVFWKSHEKNTKSISCYWFMYSSKVIYILNSYFLILYMCFLKQYTYLFSVLAYCACVFPVIIHAGSLFFALRHVFSDLLHILNFDFWIIRMCFLLFCTY